MMMNRRDDFTSATKQIIAARAGYRCCSPFCGRLTAKPSPTATAKAISIGEAAHITAASINGPRYTTNMTRDERKSAENGIWLCGVCAHTVDAAPEAFSAETLRQWKLIGETKASRDSALVKDQIGEFINTINEVSSSLLNFSGYWQANEPNIGLGKGWDIDMLIKYSNQRRKRVF